MEDSRQKQNRRASTGASSEIHSKRTRGKVASVPHNLLIYKKRSPCDMKNIRRVTGWMNRGSGGQGAKKLSRVE